LPKKVFKSFTSDRGKEFACYTDVEEELGIDFYFADPYSAWQRGTNENSNGLLREFYPKKTDLSKISNESLIKILYKINSRPRKCLEFRTTFDAFLYEINNLE
ncbi:Integrase core domain-containing protein, partial [Anaerosphaera aminiphila DSM 21120]